MIRRVTLGTLALLSCMTTASYGQETAKVPYTPQPREVYFAACPTQAKMEQFVREEVLGESTPEDVAVAKGPLARKSGSPCRQMGAKIFSVRGTSRSRGG